MGLADALTWYGSDYGAPNEFIPQAEIAARRALELDPTIPGASATLGTILYRYRYDWSGAETEFRRAIQSSPNDAFTHHKYGWYLSMKGRFEEAIGEMRQALQLAPNSLMIQADLGLPYYCSRRYAETVAMLQALSDANPKFSTAYFRVSGVAGGAKPDRQETGSIKHFHRVVFCGTPERCTQWNCMRGFGERSSSTR